MSDIIERMPIDWRADNIRRRAYKARWYQARKPNRRLRHAIVIKGILFQVDTYAEVLALLDEFRGST